MGQGEYTWTTFTQTHDGHDGFSPRSAFHFKEYKTFELLLSTC